MSSETLTKHMTNHSLNSIRNMINLKNNHMPFYATATDVTNSITDMDHFPYSRFYRGEYASNKPIIFEREAGWRNTHNNCYRNEQPNTKESNISNLCFQPACSTVYPCYNTKLCEKDLLDMTINNTCITQYR